MRNYKIFSISILMTSLAISLGYLLSPLPNIELVIPTIFFSGVLTNFIGGFTTGVITFLIFGYFNPFGPSPFPLLLAQCVGGALAGLGGGIYRKLRNNIFLCGLFGFFLTLFYDVLTTISGFIIFSTKKTFLAYVISGISFTTIHIFSGTAIFSLILYNLIRRLK